MVTDMHIVKGFDLIRSMMNQGKSFTGQFDDSCLLVIYVLGLEVLINSLYFYLNFYFFLIINRYNSIYAYGQSKLSNILHANELARRLKVLNAYKPSTIYHRIVQALQKNCSIPGLADDEMLMQAAHCSCLLANIYIYIYCMYYQDKVIIYIYIYIHRVIVEVQTIICKIFSC